MRVDYHVHLAGEGEYDYEIERIKRFLGNCRKEKIYEVGFSEHDEFLSRVNTDLVKEVQSQEFRDINIKKGVEIDFIPGREEGIKKLIFADDYDYVIGSVHFIGEWAFDHPDFRNKFNDYDIDDIYEQYYNLVLQSINTGLFDIVGHLDLIKKWGHKPYKKNSREYAANLIHAIKKSKMVVEINSSGLRKPVKEIYPSEDLIKFMFENDIPITFGSDAHEPEQIAYGYEEAYQLAWKVGYRDIVRFNKRKKIITKM